jgi:hypothetical protein
MFCTVAARFLPQVRSWVRRRRSSEGHELRHRKATQPAGSFPPPLLLCGIERLVDKRGWDLRDLAGAGSVDVSAKVRSSGAESRKRIGRLTRAQTLMIFRFEDVRGTEGDHGDPRRVGDVYNAYGNRYQKIMSDRYGPEFLVQGHVESGPQVAGGAGQVIAPAERFTPRPTSRALPAPPADCMPRRLRRRAPRVPGQAVFAPLHVERRVPPLVCEAHQL